MLPVECKESTSSMPPSPTEFPPSPSEIPSATLAPAPVPSGKDCVCSWFLFHPITKKQTQYNSNIPELQKMLLNTFHRTYSNKRSGNS